MICEIESLKFLLCNVLRVHNLYLFDSFNIYCDIKLSKFTFQSKYENVLLFLHLPGLESM